jgi:hypothetical protein
MADECAANFNSHRLNGQSRAPPEQQNSGSNYFIPNYRPMNRQMA